MVYNTINQGNKVYDVQMMIETIASYFKVLQLITILLLGAGSPSELLILVK